MNIETIGNMTIPEQRREIFIDTLVYYGEDARGRRGVVGSSCRFRADGKCCAVGRLIPDDRYQPYLEELYVLSMFRNSDIRGEPNPLYPELHALAKADPMFFIRLQQLHDTTEHWQAYAALHPGKGLSGYGAHFVRGVCKVYDWDPEALFAEVGCRMGA